MISVPIRGSSSETSTAKVTDLDDRRIVLAEIGSTGDDVTPLTPDDAAILASAITAAIDKRLPLVVTISSNGVSTDHGIASIAGWGEAARQLVRASGQVPTIFIAAGPVVSGPSLLLGVADITIFTDDAYAFVSGPHMVQSFTGVPITANSLGGAGSHGRSSGLASAIVDDVDGGLALASAILSHLPSSVDELPPLIETDDPLDRPSETSARTVPSHPIGSYDVRTIIRDIADDEEFLELKASWAPNLITGFISLGGQSIGVVANQTQALAGSIDIPAAQKGARFVAMCDAFNVPLLTLVDTSGFLPGKDLEWRGMIRHGAQMAFAYARATVPRVGLILRKSYGGAYIVMDSRYMGNDLMFAWPSAEVAVMGAKGAVEILHRKATPEERAELELEYEDRYLTPYPTAERGSISAVIEPIATRSELSAAFEILASKRERLRSRRHDNSPL